MKAKLDSKNRDDMEQDKIQLESKIKELNTKLELFKSENRKFEDINQKLLQKY